MSVIISDNNGWIISHKDYLEKTYVSANFKPKTEMFMINTAYLKEAQAEKISRLMDSADNVLACPAKKAKVDESATLFSASNSYVNEDMEVAFVTEKYLKLVSAAKEIGTLCFVSTSSDILDNNSDSRNFSNSVFKVSRLSGQLMTLFGKNDSPEPLIRKIQGDRYLLPPQCCYFCGDIFRIDSDFLNFNNFNLAVVDPPWWNKYIRRRKSANSNSSYDMLSNEKLSLIPVAGVLAPGALVAVWCTNSPSNIKALKEQIFPAWGLQYVATWFWVKVDRSGSTVCKFSKPPGKQPFERILFGRKLTGSESIASFKNPEEAKIIVSVPSAIHSHKPPLQDLLKPFVAGEPKALELFARSLLPNTTSCGLEVLKLQHKFLFEEIKHEDVPG